MPTDLDLTSLYTTIGGVLGTPAALAFLWMFFKVKEMEKRLNDGDSRFERFEKELKDNNGMLRELLGMFKMSMRAKGHTPEDA